MIMSQHSIQTEWLIYEYYCYYFCEWNCVQWTSILTQKQNNNFFFLFCCTYISCNLSRKSNFTNSIYLFKIQKSSANRENWSQTLVSKRILFYRKCLNVSRFLYLLFCIIMVKNFRFLSILYFENNGK